MTNAIVRLQNGCYVSEDGTAAYLPGLAKITKGGGIDFFTKPGDLGKTHGLNMFNIDPEDGSSLGNTIMKIVRTPDESEIEVWKCEPGESDPTKVPTILPNPTEETCTASELGSGGCSIMGGRSCDIYITNGADNEDPILIPTDYWQAEFKTGKVLDPTCKAYTSSSAYDTDYYGAWELENDYTILVLRYGCGNCNGTETVVIKDFDIIDAISLVPGGLHITGCQTNPGFGYCNLLPVENSFFSAA